MLGAILTALLRTSLRRLLRGPLRRAWSFRFELLAETQRATWNLMPKVGVVRWRYASEMFHLEAEGVSRRAVAIGGVPAEWFEAPGADGPVVLFLHGGGFVIGSPETHARLIAELAVACRSRVLAIDFRLAPEHPCPAALEDALAAYRALLANGVKAQDVIVSGDSAGGNLALIALLALRRAGDPLPAGAALICPWVDLGDSGASFQTNARFDFISDEIGKLAAGHYLDGRDPSDPEVSPLYADLNGLPPLLVQTGEAETLVDQVRDFAARAQAAGVDTQLSIYDDMIHDWHLFSFQVPEGRRAIEEIAEFARKTTGRA
jgi:acetyl esterase/lipase